MSSSAVEAHDDHNGTQCVKKLADDVRRAFQDYPQKSLDNSPFVARVAAAAATASSLPHLAQTASFLLSEKLGGGGRRPKCSVCVMPSDASIAQSVQELLSAYSQKRVSHSSGTSLQNGRTVFALPHDGKALVRSSFLQTVTKRLFPVPTACLSREAGHDDVVAFSAGEGSSSPLFACWRVADRHASSKECDSSRAHAFAFAAAAQMPVVLLTTFQTLNWLAKQRLLSPALFEVAVVGNFEGEPPPTG